MREHADEDEEGVVDPVELWRRGSGDAGGVEEREDLLAAGQVRRDFVRQVAVVADGADGKELRGRVHADFDAVAEALPVGALVR